MDFNETKYTKIRNALQAFKMYGYDSDGNGNTWLGVAAAVAEHAGLDLDEAGEKNLAERIRQFVEGTRKGNCPRHYPVPQKQTLNMIVAFLTDEDIGLLAAHEAEDVSPEERAIVKSFAGYFNEQAKPSAALAINAFVGKYIHLDSGGDANVLRLWNFINPQRAGVIQIAVTEQVIGDEASYDRALRTLAEKGCLDVRNVTCRWKGWGMSAADGNLLCLLKSEKAGEVKMYTLAGIEHAKDRPGRAPEKIVLLDHAGPTVLEGNGHRLGEITVQNVMLRSVVLHRMGSGT
ncbi:MAG: hypothetical protein H6868_08270 [Rhodospirillales bacterium]|nr:hypothetical protein [Rhodospirillales bacterium]